MSLCRFFLWWFSKLKDPSKDISALKPYKNRQIKLSLWVLNLMSFEVAESVETDPHVSLLSGLHSLSMHWLGGMYKRLLVLGPKFAPGREDSRDSSGSNTLIPKALRLRELLTCERLFHSHSNSPNTWIPIYYEIRLYPTVWWPRNLPASRMLSDKNRHLSRRKTNEQQLQLQLRMLHELSSCKNAQTVNKDCRIA